jgi:hypothetical protein
LYVGKTSLRAVSDYLAGYADAVADLGHFHPQNGWLRWVEMKFLISHSAWHWTRILVHIYGSDRAALNALPGLHAEFRAFVAEHGTDFIDREHHRRFVAEYGETWHEPKETSTSLG